MNIRDTFAKSLSEFEQTLKFYLSFKSSLEENRDIFEVLAVHYGLCRIRELFQFSHLEVTPGFLRSIEDFFKNYWFFCEETDHMYLHKPFSAFSKLMYTLAQELALHLPISEDHLKHDPLRLHKALKILFPILKTIPTEFNNDGTVLQGTLSGTVEGTIGTVESRLQNLASFVLSNSVGNKTESQALIDVNVCLENSIDDTSHLRQTGKINAKEFLKQDERIRVAMHSPASKKAFDNLSLMIDKQEEGLTFGSHLFRLINKLKKGGVHGEGSEYLAAANANEGIAEFHAFLYGITPDEGLNESELSWFLSLRDEAEKEDSDDGEDLSQSLADIWELLTHPETNVSVYNQDTIYCVDQIANQLQDILTLHKLILYSRYPMGKNNTQNEEVILQQMAHREALLKAIHEMLLEDKKSLAHEETMDYFVVHSSYGKRGKDKLKKHILYDPCIGFLQSHLDDDQRKHIATFVSDHLPQVLLELKANTTQEISFLKLIGPKFLPQIIPDFARLCIILDVLFIQNRKPFLDLLGDDYLKNLKLSHEERHVVVDKLPLQFKEEIKRKLKKRRWDQEVPSPLFFQEAPEIDLPDEEERPAKRRRLA